jgi:hypothetical protein
MKITTATTLALAPLLCLAAPIIEPIATLPPRDSICLSIGSAILLGFPEFLNNESPPPTTLDNGQTIDTLENGLSTKDGFVSDACKPLIFIFARKSLSDQALF